jgi:ubiquitin carboxyl-terminal hydrolase 34
MESNKSRFSSDTIFRIYLDYLPQWAPPLLNYYDSVVRDNMEGILTSYVLGYGPNVDFGTEPQNVDKASRIVFTAQRIGISCLEFLNSTYVRERVQAIRAYLQNILDVIDTCTTFFDEETDDEMTRRFFELKSSKYHSNILARTVN